MKIPLNLFSIVACLCIACGVTAFGEDDSADDIAAIKELAENAPKQTKAGQMVEDREMARSLIDYGLRTKTPESILLGVQILHRTPINPTKGDGDDTADLEKLVGQAVAMREDDEALLTLAERVVGELEEATRGLAGGPKQWRVKIDKGKYYRLDPTLVYNAHEKAVITAHAPGHPDVMLGAQARSAASIRPAARGGRAGRVQIQWNTGPRTTGWDVRIFNVSGVDGMEVVIETN